MLLTQLGQVLVLLGAAGAADSAPDTLPAGAIAQFGSPRLQDFTIDRAAAFSPDGKYLATSGANSPIRVWEVATGQLVRSHPNRGSVFDLRWRDDGAIVALTFFGHDAFLMQQFIAGKGPSAEEQARIDEEARKREEGRGPDAVKPGRLHHCFLSRDGRWAVAIRNSADKPVQWVELYKFAPGKSSNTATPERRADLPSGYGTWLSYDNKFLLAHVSATADQPNKIVALDLTATGGQGKPAWNLAFPGEEQRRPTVCLSADGKRIVVRLADDTVELWDAPAGKRLRELPRLPMYYHHSNGEWPGLDLAPDGKRLAMIHRDAGGELAGRIIDVDTGCDQCRLVPRPMPRLSSDARFSADGKRIVLISYGVARIWSTETGEEICPLPGHRGDVTSLVVLDGNTVVTTGKDLTVRSWRPSTAKELRQTVVPQEVAVKFTVGGAVVIAENRWGQEDTAKLLDPVSGKVRPLPGKLGEAMQDTPLAAAPDGKRIVTLLVEKSAFRIWSWPSGGLIKSVPLVPPDRMRLIRCAEAYFTPDGKRFITLLHYGDPSERGAFRDRGPDRRCIERWDLAAGTLIERFEVAMDTTVFLVPHATGVYRWTKENELRDVVTGRVGGKLVIEEGTGISLQWSPGAALSPDEQTLAVRESSSARVLLFEMRTGRLRGTLTPSGQYLTGLRFLPDGSMVTLATTATIWPVGLGSLPVPTARLEKRGLARAWGDLGSPGPEVAYAAMAKMMAAPAETVALFHEQVRSVPRALEATLDRIFRRLDSDSFREREAASQELTELGAAAVAGTKARLAGKVSPEVQRRAAAFLARYDSEEMPADELRALRAVEVLEAIHSPAATALLKELAEGLPGARLTRTAGAAVHRLEKR
jgi:WD40 repeat protein